MSDKIFLVVCLFSAEKIGGSKKKPAKNRVFFQFFQKMTKIWPILKNFCLLFFCNKSQKQLPKTFLKRIKTSFGLSLHTLTHNLYFWGFYVNISIFCENHDFLGILTKKQKITRISSFYVRIILLSEINIVHKVKSIMLFINLSYFSIKKYFWKKLKKILFLEISKFYRRKKKFFENFQNF